MGLSNPGPRVVERVESLLLASFQRELALKGKIATRATWNSIDTRHMRSVNAVRVEVLGGRGWFHIEAGKRANTKLPVKKGPDGKFRLVEPLLSWKRVVVPNIPDYLLARAIARKARAPVPLTRPATERAMGGVMEAVARGFASDTARILVRK